MTRAKCKHGDHWADREDCLLVMRKVGGSYRRAASFKNTLICLDCAKGILDRLDENGGSRGHMTVSQWSISGLRYEYDTEMRYREKRKAEETAHRSFLLDLAQKAQEPKRAPFYGGKDEDGM